MADAPGPVAPGPVVLRRELSDEGRALMSAALRGGAEEAKCGKVEPCPSTRPSACLYMSRTHAHLLAYIFSHVSDSMGDLCAVVSVTRSWGSAASAHPLLLEQVQGIYLEQWRGTTRLPGRTPEGVPRQVTAESPWVASLKGVRVPMAALNELRDEDGHASQEVAAAMASHDEVGAVVARCRDMGHKVKVRTAEYFLEAAGGAPLSRERVDTAVALVSDYVFSAFGTGMAVDANEAVPRAFKQGAAGRQQRTAARRKRRHGRRCAYHGRRTLLPAASASASASASSHMGVAFRRFGTCLRALRSSDRAFTACCAALSNLARASLQVPRSEGTDSLAAVVAHCHSLCGHVFDRLFCPFCGRRSLDAKIAAPKRYCCRVSCDHDGCGFEMVAHIPAVQGPHLSVIPVKQIRVGDILFIDPKDPTRWKTRLVRCVPEHGEPVRISTVRHSKRCKGGCAKTTCLGVYLRTGARFETIFQTDREEIELPGLRKSEYWVIDMGNDHPRGGDDGNASLMDAEGNVRYDMCIPPYLRRDMIAAFEGGSDVYVTVLTLVGEDDRFLGEHVVTWRTEESERVEHAD